ncbi:MAG: DAK2 domain-containing protein, partial [bacterium]
YGSLFMALGKSLQGEMSRAALAEAFSAAVDAVRARGKSDAGQKTMLDVLVPVLAALREGGGELSGLRETAQRAAEATIPMKATRGRASFLGERSIGHMDPGARSSALMLSAIIDVMEGRQ